MLKINNKKIATDVKVRKGFLQCSTGLMFRKKLKNSQAYLFYLPKKKPWGITMFCVFQTIDIVLLDGKKVVGVMKNIKPFTEKYPGIEMDGMVELPSGSIDKYLIREGQIINYTDKI